MSYTIDELLLQVVKWLKILCVIHLLEVPEEEFPKVVNNIKEMLTNLGE